MAFYGRGLYEGDDLRLQSDWEDVSESEPAPAVASVGCDAGQYRCNDGRCIPVRWICDYQADCFGGDDEYQQCREF